MPEFKIHSEFKMTGDQPQAVETLQTDAYSAKRIFMHNIKEHPFAQSDLL